jgi:phage replication O-like protein O
MTNSGNPQLENGYTRIAHEILEALARQTFPAEVTRIIYVVLRKTYGFGKKIDKISLSQFCKLTGMKKPNVVRALKKAVAMQIIIRRDNGNSATYQFNKKHWEWKSLSDGITLSEEITSVIPRDNKSLSHGIPTKEKKETITKEMSGKPDPAPKNSIPFDEIIAFLNSQTGKNFRTSTKSTKRLIRARWNEGYRLKDFKAVITRKVREWKGNRKMDKNLRPETLFGTHFESYLNERDQVPVNDGPDYQNLSEIDIFENQRFAAPQS